METLSSFFNNQLNEWPEAQARFDQLAQVQTKEVGLLSAQHNPARMVSTGAKVDKKAIAQRPCFLCKQNRPAVQRELPFNDTFQILINPFPILPEHFTIPALRHQQQAILRDYGVFHDLLTAFPDRMFFYNGPKCGASAPDHLHIQGGTRNATPLIRRWNEWSKQLTPIITKGENEGIWSIDAYPIPALVIKHSNKNTGYELFRRLYYALPLQDDDVEPMMNIVAWREGETFLSVVFPRQKHRPDCYYKEGEDQVLISPGALDMAGLVIVPRPTDYEKLTPTLLYNVLGECAVNPETFQAITVRLQEAYVSVGIVSAEKLHFCLNGCYLAEGTQLTGSQEVVYDNGKILWQDHHYDSLIFVPQHTDHTFSLDDVMIGVNFHWQRTETQTFEGVLRIIVNNGKLCVINDLPVEQYLKSVISSEMSATSSLELLKAHAVISRSWLLVQMINRDRAQHNDLTICGTEDDQERVRWYDRDDHTLFDVCADDHCQRYQGVTRANNPHVLEAIEATRGKVLWCDGEICDARFSKSCGGVTEEFQYCWDNTPKRYLVALADDASSPKPLPDLRNEEQARQWILSDAPAFCNTHDKQVLSQVLNGYDQETHDFYRWQVDYTQEQLRELIARKSGIDFGDILDLVPLERGTSGRICRLKIVGNKRTYIIGKELEIRRILSESHLYSSAFIVERSQITDDIPQHFCLKGAGWGHGVGLCQIGAAVMGSQGYSYTEILAHYFPHTQLHLLYQ